MRLFTLFGLIVCALAVAQPPAAPPLTPPLELWYFPADAKLENINQSQSFDDETYPAGPFTAEIQSRREAVRVEGIQLRGNVISIAAVKGSVGARKLVVKNKNVVDITLSTINYPGVVIESRGAFSLTLPSKIALKASRGPKGTEVVLADRAAFEKALTSEIDRVLGDASFDKYFTIRFRNLSDVGDTVFRGLFNRERPRLLAELRNSLKAEALKSGFLDNLLRDLGKSLPSYVMGGTDALDLEVELVKIGGGVGVAPVFAWCARRPTDGGFSPAVIARLAPQKMEARGATLVAHVDALGFLFKDFAAGAERGDGPGAALAPGYAREKGKPYLSYRPPQAEAAGLADFFGQWIPGVGPQQMSEIRLFTSGPAAPALRFWYLADANDLPQRRFLDVVTSFELEGKDGTPARVRLALVFECEAAGVLRLRKVSALDVVAPAAPAPAAANGIFALGLGRQLGNLMLKSVVEDALEQLETQRGRMAVRIRDIRWLGNAGERSRNQFGVNRWAEAIAIDLEIK